MISIWSGFAALTLSYVNTFNKGKRGVRVGVGEIGDGGYQLTLDLLVIQEHD